MDTLLIDSPFVISDHAAIYFYLMLKKPAFEKKLITFRKLRSVDSNNFGSDDLNSSLPSLFSAPLLGLDDLVIIIIIFIIINYYLIKNIVC